MSTDMSPTSRAQFYIPAESRISVIPTTPKVESVKLWVFGVVLSTTAGASLRVGLPLSLYAVRQSGQASTQHVRIS